MKASVLLTFTLYCLRVSVHEVNRVTCQHLLSHGLTCMFIQLSDPPPPPSEMT